MRVKSFCKDTNTFSLRLDKVIDLHSGTLQYFPNAFLSIIREQSRPKMSIASLLEFYLNCSKYTVPALTMSAHTLSQTDPHLSTFFRDHAIDETGHDLLLKSNLQKHFGNYTGFLNQEFVSIVDKFFKDLSQNCRTEKGAVEYLAYIYIAERDHISSTLVENLETLACLNKKSLSALWLHAEEDAEHAKNNSNLLNSSTLNDMHRCLILEKASELTEGLSELMQLFCLQLLDQGI